MHLSNGIYSEIPINRKEITQTALDIADKARSNPLRWKGQFSPQLVHVLLKNYASQDDVLFDPFLGSGTVLLESGILNFKASGTEINPAAINLAQTYHFINLVHEERRSKINAISRHLESIFPLQLFQNDLTRASESIDIENSEEIKHRLLKSSNHIECHLETQLFESLITLLDFHQTDLCEQKIFSIWKNLQRHIIHLPYSPKQIKVIHADSRQTNLEHSSIDFVITSPPYINVFNYHQQYRASMEALNWDLLKIAKSEFGSNRKHRSNRFLTVIQFCLDIAQTFNELSKICKPGARIIFVVGRESNVNKTPFFNGEIVAEVAYQSLGFGLYLRQERCFKNRFGQNIYEDILHFSVPQRTNANIESYLASARMVAEDVLRHAYESVPEDKKIYIKSAIENVLKTLPSPLFSLPDNVH